MMKRILSLFAVFALVGVVALGIYRMDTDSETTNNGSLVNETPEGIFDPLGKTKKKKQHGAEGYMKLLEAMRVNQNTGKIDPADLVAGREQAAVLKAAAKNRATGLGLVWEEMGPDNIGGRTRAILIDRNNPNRMYAGGVSGGLFISNNAGASWTPYALDDTLAGIGVVSFAQAANGDIYLGTGERYVGNTPSGNTLGSNSGLFQGEGMWRSTDGGNTFVHLSSTTPLDIPNSDWFNVPALVAHPTNPDVIYAGTNKGIQKSTDKGNTWSKITGNPVLASGLIQDLDITPDGVLFAVVIGGSANIFRSSSAANTDDLVDINTLPNNNFPNVFSSRYKLAIAPSDPNYVYVIGCNGAGQTNVLTRSFDKGNTWTSKDFSPPSLPSTVFNPTGTQGWYDMEIAVNLADRERVFVGGQYSVYEWTPSSGWYAVSNWWSGPNTDPRYIHADHHIIINHPTNADIMYIGTDGGIFRTLNARIDYEDGLPTFQPLNKNFSTTQFYSVAGGLDGSVLGGTQDNGSILIDFTGNTLRTGKGVLGGDGTFADISKTNPNAMFYAVYEGQFRRSSNKGSTSSFYFDTRVDSDNDNRIDCGAPFITPFRLWEETLPDTLNLEYYQSMTKNTNEFPHVDTITDTKIFVIDTTANGIPFTQEILRDTIRNTYFGEGRIFAATNCGVWMARDALNFGANPTWFRITPITFTGAANIPSYIEVSQDGDVAYVGTVGGRLYRIDGLKNPLYRYVDYAGTPNNPDDDQFLPDSFGIKTTQIALFNGRFITGVAIDKNNNDHVAVSLGNYGNQAYVYRSTSASSDTVSQTTGSFTSIQGVGTASLPKIPIYSVVIDYYNPNNIIVGTEMGIYSTANGNSSNPTWSADNGSMPFTANFQMRQEVIESVNSNCFVLYVGTHGRGIWRSTTLTPSGCNTTLGTIGIKEQGKVNKNALHVYPNPVKYTVNISMELSKAGDGNISVYDVMGRKVMERSVGKLPVGKQTLQLDMSKLPAGNYVLNVRAGDINDSKIIVVTK